MLGQDGLRQPRLSLGVHYKKQKLSIWQSFTLNTVCKHSNILAYQYCWQPGPSYVLCTTHLSTFELDGVKVLKSAADGSHPRHPTAEKKMASGSEGRGRARGSVWLVSHNAKRACHGSSLMLLAHMARLRGCGSFWIRPSSLFSDFSLSLNLGRGLIV